MADQQYSPRDGQAFDVVLIGGGTGGYVAAIRAAQLGLDAVVVEIDKLGGTCLHRGCIPTKAFLKSADVYEEVQHSADFGVDIAGEVAFNYPAALDRSFKVVNGQYKGLQYLFDKKYKIPVIAGFGRIAGPGQVQVTPAGGGTPFTLTARNIIIDTGTRPRAIKDLPFDGERVINSDDAVVLETLPQSFIIRGGGAVGVEWASIYGRYGSKVSLVGRVVPAEADVLLVAIGREGNVEDIGLEKVGVATADGLIPVDAMMRTNVPNVFAISDVNGQQMLAHTAMHMGVIAVEHIAGHKPYPLDVLNSPMVTFCRPEIASVGLTEKQAVDQGRTVKSGKFPMRPNGKAVIEGETDGFAK